MKILMVSSEVAPFSKTGGLADVAGALPRALGNIPGCDVRVVSPFYRMIKKGPFKTEKSKVIKNIPGRGAGDFFELREREEAGVRFYFIGKDEYYDRDGIYGTSHGDYSDNAARFSFLSASALATAVETGFYPDIIHINDWQTALLPIYKKGLPGRSHPLKKSKVLFTVHNLGYQGVFSKKAIADTGLSREALREVTSGESINFIKSGILYSDAINAVSKKYAEEILTPEYGCGMEGILKKRAKDLYGILNGADYSDWNPETDSLIDENYNAEALHKKKACKLKLLEYMNIDIPPEAPLVGSVGRLVYQKGIDIMLASIDDILELGAGFVLLGTGEELYEAALTSLASEYKGKIGVSIRFDNKLAHMIEAGADMFVMPSRYEPCGLNQMYSLKYGTVPIVRATGGLDDTITDYFEARDRGNGFKFAKPDIDDFMGALGRAVEVFKGDKKEWGRIQKRGMASDFSWRHAAVEYNQLYKKMLGEATTRGER